MLFCVAQQLTIGPYRRAQHEEVRHLFGKLLAACLVDALVISVFSESEDGSLRGHTQETPALQRRREWRYRLSYPAQKEGENPSGQRAEGPRGSAGLQQSKPVVG